MPPRKFLQSSRRDIPWGTRGQVTGLSSSRGYHQQGTQAARRWLVYHMAVCPFLEGPR